MGSNNETLCWRCKRPGTRTCSWDDSKGNVPVDGWTAEETSISVGPGERVRTYFVIDCPLFDPVENYKERMRSVCRGEEDGGKPEHRERRKQINRLFGYGRSNKEIADKFGLSVKTIQGYKTRWRKEQEK